MTIQEVLNQTRHTDALGVEVLLAHVLGIPKEELFAHAERTVLSDKERTFRELLNRMQRGEPVAYLTGTKEFYGLEFAVNPSVLIPRPETELLVDKVLEMMGRDAEVSILDVGTGCGALATALAKNMKRAKVTATDISAAALKVAKENARTHGVGGRLSFVEADLLQGVQGCFDVVVANLPYIGEERFRFVSRETERYEPHVALFGGPDGLELYRQLFQQLSRETWKPGLLVGEFGFLQGDEMRELLNKFFTHDHWRIEKDYASIERIFVVTSGNV